VPAPVPPGYTRGSILLLGHQQHPHVERQLYQRFWNEAGRYGARILIVPTETDSAAEHYRALFQEWEADAVDILPLTTRHAAQQEGTLAAVEQATAILLLNRDPLHLARTLGGTAVAQAIRRANARSKCVGAVGMGASVLCQHMLIFDGEHPRFAPGLGLINRLAIDVQCDGEPSAQSALQRLLATIAYNPFLVGVRLAQDTGIAIYPDTSLEVFGERQALVIDGAGLTETLSTTDLTPEALQALGVRVYWLNAGSTFNFDQRTVHTPPPGDLPTSAVPAVSKSSF